MSKGCMSNRFSYMRKGPFAVPKSTPTQTTSFSGKKIKDCNRSQRFTFWFAKSNVFGTFIWHELYADIVTISHFLFESITSCYSSSVTARTFPTSSQYGRKFFLFTFYISLLADHELKMSENFSCSSIPYVSNSKDKSEFFLLLLW